MSYYIIFLLKFISGEETDEVYVLEAQREPQQVAEREAVCEVAHMLRDLGDRYTKEYGQPLVVSLL